VAKRVPVWAQSPDARISRQVETRAGHARGPGLVRQPEPRYPLNVQTVQGPRPATTIVCEGTRCGESPPADRPGFPPPQDLAWHTLEGPEVLSS
jgi:hypothetical protein